MRGPSSNPLGGSDPDSDFDSWINSSFFDDDDDKDLKTGQPTVATVTGVKPTSTKAAGIDFDAPLANGDDEPSTAGTTTTASDPENVHNTNLPEATEGGRKPSKTGFHKGEHKLHIKEPLACKANGYKAPETHTSQCQDKMPSCQ